MKLILQSIKSLLSKINTTIAGIDNSVKLLGETKADKENATFTGHFSLNRNQSTEWWNVIGKCSSTLGKDCVASGDYSHAEGYESRAEGDFSHAENRSTASGDFSHAEGSFSHATGHASHAEGVSTASGDYSHAENHGRAIGRSSHAENTGSAYGEYSHAEGYDTIASADNSHVQGKYNIEDTEKKYAHIVGNGYVDFSSVPGGVMIRSNAHTLDWDGNGWFAGSVEATHIILKSSTEGSTKRFKITVDDAGTLTATAI